jgi:hypothetical protein
MRMPKLHRFTQAAVATLALPLLTGAHCGLALDYTETFLITDPIDLIVIVVDDGNVDAVSYERSAVLLKRHVFAFENILESPSYSVEDGVIRFEGHCKDNDDICSFDHLLELPMGIGFDITMDDGRIDLGYIDAEIQATIETGRFKGIRLAAPEVIVTAGAADVAIDFAAQPEAVTIDLDRGDVALELPPGEYQCTLDTANGDATVESATIVCSDTATTVLDVHVRVGDIHVTEAKP